ncbi:Glycosyltransferase involved in cell wall bisynthesis [Caldanaerovirga acetigignens]|uniref:Glycosyltransferase involved in cell wall bisynthesis n=1 Tax=Caldanaerovirga acetigignens TaxID=447595 RepID=A0A1M7JZR5_9FIRM|nr:glycosyltransferase family 4 protein [Caldanaerovirga acetigignens]SHM58478.1 Glycosyltransferase involved in cell wall bisynthesis [Caldanaerovirga acetigignens]
MKKVLHVITDTNIGGAGRYLLNLLSAWDESRYSVAVACPAGGELEKRLKDLGVKVYLLKGGEKSFKILHLVQILGIIAREKVDLIHTHASLSGRIAGRLLGRRVVLTRHWMGKKSEMGIFRPLINRIFYQLLTDRVIAVSRAVKVSLMEIGVPAWLIKTVYNGIDVPNISGNCGKLRKELNMPERIPLIGMIGRLVPEKGHEYAIRAMPEVLKKFHDTRLVLVGDGPFRPYLEDLCGKVGVKDKVVFLGFRKDVEEIAIDFDVILMPSLSEGLPLALLESMALGKPVVASEAGGIPEIIKDGENGVLVPPKDEGALAEKIIRLLTSNEMREKLGENARQTVLSKFTAKIMAENTMRIYDELLK